MCGLDEFISLRHELIFATVESPSGGHMEIFRHEVERRPIVKGAAWAVPALAVASAAPAVAASGTQYPSTPIYRNVFSNVYETWADSTNCPVTYTIDALTNSTDPNNTEGFWLEADTPGYGDVTDLSYTLTMPVQGLTWTVTATSGVGTWLYAGETVNSNGTSSYRFVYSGPNTMAVNVGVNYQIDIANASTGFQATSSATQTCHRAMTVTTTYSSSRWGTAPFSYSESKNL